MGGITACKWNSKSDEEKKQDLKPIKITHVDSNFERQPLVRPFGFKGVYQHKFWVCAALMKSSSGIQHVGIQTQYLAWSGLSVFLAYTEVGGNVVLLLTLEHALQQIQGSSFNNPLELQDAVLEEAHQYGKKITADENLKMTFTLSSLVALDNAAWMIYARENGFKNFD